MIVDYFDVEWLSTIIFLLIILTALIWNNSSFSHDDDMISITHVSQSFFEVNYFLIIPF